VGRALCKAEYRLACGRCVALREINCVRIITFSHTLGVAILSDLSFELHFDTDIYNSSSISLLQKTLSEISPVFCEKLRVLEFERDSKYIAIDINDPMSLAEAVKSKGLKRGPTYEKLSAKHPPRTSRRFGSTMVYGNARSTFFNVSFDEYVPSMKMGDKWLFSNTISGFTNAPKISGITQAEWIRQLMAKMSADPAILWGAAFHKDEFNEKNIRNSAEGMNVLGRNMRNHLPGLYWLNIFGPKYRDFIGDNKFNGLETYCTEIVGLSRVIELYDNPEDWSTKIGRDTCKNVANKIGEEYFFNKEKPNAKTIAPEFILPTYS
jgi:hypothetical protein